jgi:hypothetical protein
VVAGGSEIVIRDFHAMISYDVVTLIWFGRSKTRYGSLQRVAGFRGATRGALVSFVGLIAAVTIRFALATSWTVGSAILAVAALVAVRLRADVLWVVLGGILLSLLAVR